jgi:negative regulator of sigma F NrsF-like protein
MLEGEIDYKALIDHSIKDFQPAAKLWPVGVRLVLWIFFELTLLTLCASVNGLQSIASLIQSRGILIETGAFTLASVAAGLLALRSAIPAREPVRSELLLVIGGVCAAFAVAVFQPFTALSQMHNADLHWLLQMLGFSILPWTGLFCAVARGVPLRPFETGGLIGIASFCFGVAAECLILESTGSASLLVWQAAFGIIVATGSALAGAYFLNPVRRWQGNSGLVEAQSTTAAFFSRSALVPLAIGGSIATLFLVLSNAGRTSHPIPDFDLTIAKYEGAVANFTPNVPSRDIETMLTAYVENGMPTYMWDFSRQGFKFVGGRFEHLPDGAAVTYTWFHGVKSGVMCMFRQTDGFKAPPGAYEERQHLLFYRYRGFSVCLINVGRYGSFLSVIVAQMPMDRFMPLVLAATT